MSLNSGLTYAVILLQFPFQLSLITALSWKWCWVTVSLHAWPPSVCLWELCMKCMPWTQRLSSSADGRAGVKKITGKDGGRWSDETYLLILLGICNKKKIIIFVKTLLKWTLTCLNMPYLIIICYLLNLNIVRCPKLTTINTQLTDPVQSISSER